MLLSLLISCSGVDGEACPCPGEAHGAVVDDRCLCLVKGPATPDPDPLREVAVSPEDPPDWEALDALLAEGPVHVRFARTTWPERIRPRRRDPSTHRLILDGGSGTRRAIVPGILTEYGDAVVSHVTVRGFEVTGSKDKGVFWNAGDEVLLEDLLVHDNGGSPAVNLQYSNRSGHRSTGFTLRNSHVWNQRGECVYIGGSEGEEQPSHERVVLEHNLIHDCFLPTSTKADGINVKDRIGHAEVTGNVVFHTDWGIEVASPGLYQNNLVFRTRREGFQVGDFFGPLDAMHFVDNAVIEPGHDGFHLTAEHHPAGVLEVERATVIGAGEAGVLVGGEFPLTVSLVDVAVADSPVGFDGWGEGEATLESCATSGNETDDDRNLGGLAADCSRARPGDASRPAGPDDTFFTEDDPWLLDGAGAQLPSSP